VISLRYGVLSLVVLLVLPAFAQESGSDPQVEAFIRSEMERQHVPGLAVGIVKGTSVSARGYGYANLEHKVAVTPDTIFQSGSLGKMFTATAVMLQVEDGKLSLADPIGKFFPGAPKAWQPYVSPKLNTTADGALYLTLRDLLAWDAAVRRRAILRAESWAQILTPVKLNDGSTYPYRFGWALNVRGGQPMYHHGGSWQGFKTHLAQFIGDDLSIIVLANAGQAEPGEIVLGIAAILDPQLAKK
jgi:CubicO group peptidase (beta-lactamase class C family)